MTDAARYALHRPELHELLARGEKKILSMMAGSGRSHAAGAVLIEADTQHDYVYRLVSGWAGRVRSLGDGREQCILVFLPGDLFAVRSMFVQRHPDSVRVLSAARIERLHYRDLFRASRGDSEVASRCISQLIDEECRLHHWAVGLGERSAEERLATMLVDFHGRVALSGVIEQADHTFEMPLTHAHMADHLGIAAVHISRVLKNFRESGIALVRDGLVSILNFEALARLAAPLPDPQERAVVSMR